jgi:hypothetical protein
MSDKWRFLLVVAALIFPLEFLQAQPRLTSSASGAAGRLDGENFVLEDRRNRFTFPQDKSLIVYFEWDADPGDYALTATWKDPAGKIGFISTDVRMRTTSRKLRAYWEYYLAEGMPSGYWQVEVRANGQPAGSHAFELVIPEAARETAKKAPAPPTLDELYKLRASIVFLHRHAADGRVLDTSSGFVIRDGRILTAFQAVDGAHHVMIEYSGGRKERVDRLLAWDARRDWALLPASTDGHPPLEISERTPAIGDRLIVFSVEAELTRVIGGIDLAGRVQDRQAGELLHLNPNLPFAAVGGPLLDEYGKVIGLVIGNLLPGSRGPMLGMGTSPEFYNRLTSFNRVLPIGAIPAEPAPGEGLFTTLVEKGVFVRPLAPHENFIAAGTARQTPREDGILRAGEEMARFSRRDPQVVLMSLWALRQKQKRVEGMVSAKVHATDNSVRVAAPPLLLKLTKTLPVRHTISFSPSVLPAGIYRVDLEWDGRTVWRTFLEITE